MQKRITALLTTICLIIMAASLTGCGGKTSAEESSGRAAVCYVIAPTANSQGLNFNSPLVQDTIYDTILNYGYISVVVVGSNNPWHVYGAGYEGSIAASNRAVVLLDASCDTAKEILSE